MTVKEIETGADYVARYSRPKFGSKDAELAWRDQCRKDRESQKVIACVSRGCTVSTVNETTLREFEELTAQDVGGHGNLERLKSVGVASVVTEREAATNRGEFECVTKKSIVHVARILDKGEGFNVSELDIPAEEPIQRIDDRGRVVTVPGRPGIDGAKLAEEWIRKDLAERARLREAVVRRAKEILKGSGAGKGKAGE